MNASHNPQNAEPSRAPVIVFLLHLACCGLPLLIAFGAFGATGALLANPWVAGAVVLAVLVGVLVNRPRFGAASF